MEIEELNKELKDISPHLIMHRILTNSGLYQEIIYYQDKDSVFSIFDWNDHQWTIPQKENPLPEDQQRALERFYESRASYKILGANEPESVTTIPELNSFKDYTDHLADVLQSKNDAYGDSFGKSLDEDGLLVLKIRLGDKFNRISSLIKKNELKENDESLEGTLLDLAGYSILGLRWLKEHENNHDE